VGEVVRSLVADDRNVRGTAQAPERRRSNLDRDVVGELERVLALVLDQLTEHRRLFKRGYRVLEHDRRLSLVGRDHEDHAALAWGQHVAVVAKRRNVRYEPAADGLRLAAAATGDNDQLEYELQLLRLAGRAWTMMLAIFSC